MGLWGLGHLQTLLSELSFSPLSLVHVCVWEGGGRPVEVGVWRLVLWSWCCGGWCNNVILNFAQLSGVCTTFICVLVAPNTIMYNSLKSKRLFA